MTSTKFLPLASFLICFLLLSCKDETYPANPEDVLKKYLEIANGEKSGTPGASLKYCTKDSEEMIRSIEKNMNPSDTANRSTLSNMHIRKTEIKGEKAIIKLYNDKTKMISFFTLLKEDGKWKVNVSREGMIEITKLVLTHYGVNIDDLQSGKITQDSAKKIMENYQRLHPGGE